MENEQKLSGRVFKLEDVEFEKLKPGDVIKAEGPDGSIVTMTALEPDDDELGSTNIEKSFRSGVAEFGVSRVTGGRKVPVYSSATSTTQVGLIYPGESFLFTGARSGSRYEIEFLNSAGTWRKGWYIGTDGMSFWRNHPAYHGNITITGDWGSGTYRCYNVTRNTGIYAPNGQSLGPGSVPGNRRVFIQSSECYPGTYNRDYMRIIGFSAPDYPNWYRPCSEFGSYYGYIDTQMQHGSANVAVRGNW